MPIDLTLLRPPDEGGNPLQVIEWQYLRISATDVGVDGIPSPAASAAAAVVTTAKARAEKLELVRALQQCDSSRRSTLRDLNAARKRVNELNRKLRPSEENEEVIDRDAIKEKVRTLSSSRIPQLIESVTLLEAKMGEQLLPKLGNSVDTTTFSVESKHECGIDADNGSGAVWVDSLYCLGGYETLALPISGAGLSSKSGNKSVILSGCAVSLADALSRYASRFLSQRGVEQETENKYKLLRCSSTVKIDKDTAHNVLGCSQSISAGVSSEDEEAISKVCSICSATNNAYQVPSFVTAAALHSGKQYPDGKLPILHLCKSMVDRSTSADQKEPIKSFSHQMEHVSIFSLTLPTVASSRLYQDELATSIVGMYDSLLIPEEATPIVTLPNRVCTKICPLVRAHTLEIPSLAMNECRRIVIEGYLPLAEEYIELAFVSNTTDYVSRAFGIKCGGKRHAGGGGGPDHPHIVHGTVCDVRATLSWISENNAAKILREGEHVEGLALPHSLSEFIQTDEDELFVIKKDALKFLFLPFCRRLIVGKKGKTIVVEKDERDKLRSRLGNQKKEPAKEAAIQFTIDRPPTQLELEAEALSNSFGFLPIGV